MKPIFIRRMRYNTSTGKSSIPVDEYYDDDHRLHRLDGPAVIWDDDEHDWYVHNFNITSIIILWAIDMSIDLKNLSNDDKILIAMKWSDYDGK